MRTPWLLGLLYVAVPDVEIENRSQYTIVELRIHAGGSYADAENILEAPLEIGETIAPSAEEGPRFIKGVVEPAAGCSCSAITKGK